MFRRSFEATLRLVIAVGTEGFEFEGEESCWEMV
jgi:hypothetical protein